MSHDVYPEENPADLPGEGAPEPRQVAASGPPLRDLSELPLDTQLLHVAHQAALSVEPYLKSVARSAPTIDTKASIHDPVTVHDKATEESLRRFLSNAVPGSRFLGEEMGEGGLAPNATSPFIGDVTDLGARVRWIIDPIDGTANFASGLVYFCTSIAAELDGKVVAGAITVPVVGESFLADATRAWHVGPGGVETKMRADGPSSEDTALLATYYPGLWALNNRPQMALDHDRALMTNYATVRRPGAGALDLAHVAAGWIGVSMGVGFKPWDVAAGIHMVRVAGGKVLNLPMGTDLPDGLRPGVVSSGANLDARTAKRVLTEVQEARWT